jgi:hypothetical protein
MRNNDRRVVTGEIDMNYYNMLGGTLVAEAACRDGGVEEVDGRGDLSHHPAGLAHSGRADQTVLFNLCSF